MAKQLIDECKMPGALALFSTGNATADAALAKLSVWELSAYDPNPRPYSDDYKQACKTAAAAGWTKLLPLLDDAKLFEIGGSVWDEDRHAKLSPSNKKAYQKVADATAHASKARLAYIAFLIEAVLPEGYERVLEIASDDDIDPKVRSQAQSYLQAKLAGDKTKLLEVARSFDIKGWNGKDSAHETLIKGCVRAWNLADPKACFDELHVFITPEAVAKNERRADAIVSALMRGDYDPRWATACAALVGGPVNIVACLALENLPRDPAIIDPILEALGKLDKIQFFFDGLIKNVARVATMKSVPLLKRMLVVHPACADTVFEMIPEPAVIAAVKSGGVPAVVPEGRERPRLVYKKVKPFKAPKLATLAKQEAEWKSMFEKAGIADAISIAQRCVVMVPKRVNESTLEAGATKLGGHPDLPTGVEWPRVAGEPLTFLAQLRFGDFAPLLPKGALPKAGTLAIFVDNDARSAKGEYLKNARAIFSKPGSKLGRREVPDDFVDEIYQACSVELREKLSLPSPSNAHVTKTLGKATVATYEEKVFVHGEALPQVLGYRDHGYDAEEPATAQLLLQLTGDNQSGMEFGDCDHLSFFIDAKKLAKGDFSKVWPHVGD